MAQQTGEEREVTMEELRKDYAQIRGVYAAAIQEIDARLKTLNSEFHFGIATIQFTTSKVA